jgi:hypothetical protein
MVEASSKSITLVELRNTVRIVGAPLDRHDEIAIQWNRSDAYIALAFPLLEKM